MTENHLGRLAGFLYFVVVVTGIFSLMYVPSRVTSADGTQAIVAHLVTDASLYRLGNASLLANQLAFLLLPLVLFRLMRRTDEASAVLMVAFAWFSVPPALVAIAHRVDAVTLAVAGPGSAEQTAELVMASLRASRSNLLMASLFWGLWLLPFGFLAMRARLLPRFIAVCLTLGGLGYVVGAFGTLLVPGYAETTFAQLATIPAAIGEIGACFWLLAFGAPRDAIPATGTAQSTPA